MTINEMIQKRAKVWETAKNFVDTHENESGVLSAEDNETYGRMEKEIEDLTNAIDRQQRAEAREAELSKPVNAPITARPAKQEEDKPGRASNAYKEDFGAHLRGKRPVHNVLSEGVQADIVNIARAVSGCAIAVSLRETDGKIKISFRSNGEISVSQIAQKFGGGGHAKAAGAKVTGKTIEQVKAEVKDAVLGVFE